MNEKFVRSTEQHEAPAPRPRPWREPRITINGTVLSDGEAIAVRVALNAFDESLDAGLGDDVHGRAMVRNYRTAIHSTQEVIYARSWWVRLLDWIDEG